MAGRSRLRFGLGALASCVAALAIGAAATSSARRELRVVPHAGGSVRDALGSGVACGVRCVVRVRAGSAVDLRASPRTPFEFGRWDGWCVGAAPRCVLFVDGAARVIPTFAREAGTVDGMVSGPGMLVSDPGGLQCGGEARDCKATLGQGVSVQLFAQPAEGRYVRGWTGACAQTVGDRCRFVVSASQRAGVIFGRQAPLPGAQRLTFLGEYNDFYKLTSDPAGISCPPTCAADFPSGTLVTLRPGYASVRAWTRGCIGFAETCTVSVDEPTWVEVAPPPPPAAPPPPVSTLRVTVSGPGTVVSSRILCGVRGTACKARVAGVTVVRFRAQPVRGARFAGWRGRCRGTRVRCTLRVTTGAADVIAVFRPSRG